MKPKMSNIPKTIKKFIYSSYLGKYINILDVAELIVFNDFPNSDAGYFELYAVIFENGFQWFNGEISWEYTDWCGNLDGLTKHLEWNKYQKEIKLLKIGLIYGNPDTTISNDDLLWDDLWKKVSKKADKLAKEIYEAQKSAYKEKMEQSIVL